MTDAYFLIVAERQARPGAGFEALLLPDEIVGVLIEDRAETRIHALGFLERLMIFELDRLGRHRPHAVLRDRPQEQDRSEEHTSELQSLMRISYAVFCL